MTKGLKTWLWIVLVVNIIACLSYVMLGIAGAWIGWACLVLGLAIVGGDVLLLFKNKKMGFFIIVGAGILSIILNIVTGSNPVTSIISGALLPLIIYLLMKKTWDQFE